MFMDIPLNYNHYPVLSQEARIIRMNDCCALIDRVYGSYVLLEPFAAVVIAMCNGAVNLERLISITNELIDGSFEDTKQIVLKTLNKAKEYIYWSNFPEKLEWRYNPADYLYHTEKRSKETLKPLQKPLQMTLVLTNECNYNCIYCFRSAKEKWDNELTKEEIFNLIEQAAELEVKYCSLTGGEPTIHPHFEEVVLKLLKHDIYPYISSNGSALSKQTLLNMKDAGLHTIQFSMDSANPEIFDKMVGVKKLF